MNLVAQVRALARTDLGRAVTWASLHEDEGGEVNIAIGYPVEDGGSISGYGRGKTFEEALAKAEDLLHHCLERWRTRLDRLVLVQLTEFEQASLARVLTAAGNVHRAASAMKREHWLAILEPRGLAWLLEDGYGRRDEPSFDGGFEWDETMSRMASFKYDPERKPKVSP